MYLRSMRRKATEVSLTDALEADEEGGGMSLMDLLSEESDLDERLALAEQAQKVRNAVKNTLNEREAKVIRLRYGLDGKAPMTQRRYWVSADPTSPELKRKHWNSCETSWKINHLPSEDSSGILQPKFEESRSLRNTQRSIPARRSAAREKRWQLRRESRRRHKNALQKCKAAVLPERPEARRRRRR